MPDVSTEPLSVYFVLTLLLLVLYPLLKLIWVLMVADEAEGGSKDMTYDDRLIQQSAQESRMWELSLPSYNDNLVRIDKLDIYMNRYDSQQLNNTHTA